MTDSLNNNSITNRRFNGFRNTNFLWEGVLEEMKMVEVESTTLTGSPLIDSTDHIRLGKLIEKFVLYELEQNDSIEILESNLQIFRNQITIGELDCLLKYLEAYIHLEIVYKFYLYDPTITGELNRWIGPNRKDSLVQKLTKLKEKQLPLLYHSETKKLLNQFNVSPNQFIQQLYFKAQLFVPLSLINSEFQLINNSCIKGFYLRLDDLVQFENHEFYVPSKLDWIVDPDVEVKWISSEDFRRSVSEFLSVNKSPMCWMKSPAGELQKFFVVWW